MQKTAFVSADITYANPVDGPLIVNEPPEGMGDADRNFTDDVRNMSVVNARHLSQPPSLDKAGFCLLDQASAFQNFDNSDDIRSYYLPESENLLKETLGASRVFAFDFNIRVDSSNDAHRKPAGIVHIDLTEKSARRIVKDHLSAVEADEYLSSRFVFINIWRPLIEPVSDSHLALCDASTVSESSLLKAELRYVDRVGELYYCAFHKLHRWYYFPNMLKREILLLKNFDSAVDGRARFTPHTAIKDSGAPIEAPARKSIEVRTVAFFD